MFRPFFTSISLSAVVFLIAPPALPLYVSLLPSVLVKDLATTAMFFVYASRGRLLASCQCAKLACLVYAFWDKLVCSATSFRLCSVRLAHTLLSFLPFTYPPKVFILYVLARRARTPLTWHFKISDSYSNADSPM